MQDEDLPPGGYVSFSVSVALASGFLAFWVALFCLWSAYGEALEPPFVCDADNCVLDDRSWFGRHLGLWSLAVGLVATCVVSIGISRRRRIHG